METKQIETQPGVPEYLVEDFRQSDHLTISFRDSEGKEQRMVLSPGYCADSVQIVLRPEILVTEYRGESDPKVTTIPFERIRVIEGHGETAVRDEQGERWPEPTPLFFWARHPERGLLRFTAQ